MRVLASALALNRSVRRCAVAGNGVGGAGAATVGMAWALAITGGANTTTPSLPALPPVLTSYVCALDMLACTLRWVDCVG